MAGAGAGEAVACEQGRAMRRRPRRWSASLAEAVFASLRGPRCGASSGVEPQALARQPGTDQQRVARRIGHDLEASTGSPGPRG